MPLPTTRNSCRTHDATPAFRNGSAGREDLLRAIVRGPAEHLEAPGGVAIVTDLVDVADCPEQFANWWTGGREFPLSSAEYGHATPRR